MRMLAAFSSVLLLAGCAGGTLPGGQPVAVAAAPVAAPAVAPSPPPPPSSSGGARGGSTTARRAPVEDPDAPTPTGDPVIQARADCWMAVEHRHELRGIDQRITFVDKCVAEKTKGR
jgi:hypothetical protein